MPHRRWKIIKVAPLILVVAASHAPASKERQLAPLPAGVIPSGGVNVRGLYAEARFGNVIVNEDVARLESTCAERGVPAKIEGRELQWSGRRQIYRSSTSIAVFEDTPTIAFDEPRCTARISLVRDIKTMEASTDNLRLAGWDDQPLACSKPRFLVNRCTNQVVAGVAAKCINMGDGLVGTTACYSRQDDLSRGLRLASSSYTDDGSGPDSSWQLDVVMVDTLIDTAVFRAR